MRRAILLLTLTLSTLPALADKPPDLFANVTHVTTPTDFDIDGLHVHLTPATTFENRKGEALSPLAAPAPFVGQVVQVWGRIDRKSLSIDPTRIIFYDPRPYVVKGMALIELVPAPTPQAHILRADGRFLEISNNTLDHPVALPAGAPPPATNQDLHPNVWVEYHGLRRSDGIVAVDHATFQDNKVDKSEEKLREKNDYKPDPAKPADTQGPKGRLEEKSIAAYKDEVMQARIDRIGQSLIPGFQRALPPNDPTRINFRFQLVDRPTWRDAVGLASGILLIPYQIVHRLPDDSELAAVIADSIAGIFEKQALRLGGVVHTLTGASIATAAVSFIPTVGLLGSLAAGTTGGVLGNSARNIAAQAEQQSGRVALTLMYDAGYDIDKAPEAWWTLAAKPGEEPHLHRPPNRAADQYDELGTTWQPANRTRPAGN